LIFIFVNLQERSNILTGTKKPAEKPRKRIGDGSLMELWTERQETERKANERNFELNKKKMKLKEQELSGDSTAQCSSNIA
jgi:hypothetical protein